MIYMFKGRLLCDSCTRKEKKKSMDANCINCAYIKSVDVLDLKYKMLATLKNIAKDYRIHKTEEDTKEADITVEPTFGK